jgi:hypothetical protein
MPVKKIFITQQVLDTLFSEGKASLDGDRLTILSKKDSVYKLSPAYKFLYVVDNARDVGKMVGKIFTTKELEKIKADIYMDSILVNEVAYQVETGFVGEPEEQPSSGPAEESDEDLLSEYLLKIL